MQPTLDATIYVVDDDASVRDALAWLLRSRHLPYVLFASGEAFLEEAVSHFSPSQPSCLLLDVRMPGMSGLALFDIIQTKPWASVLPIIFLTGHADVPTAVDTVKRGAFDFFEKPFSDNALVDRVEQALAASAKVVLAQKDVQALRQRHNELTEREHDVLQLVVQGLPNKLIADQLSISVRTVEVHRARVFDKMGVKSAVELANLLQKIQR
jgi:two-component system, LuxR family, response regulator DctR